LLYGIARDTHDDHVHKKSELRVGGRLSGGGSEVTIVRRKGLRETLLDPSGAPMDDLPLRRMLGGVSEELFRTMFGLDHESLRPGARAILDGGGDVGEGLSGAAVGGAALRETLVRLRAEADRLFTPQAHKRPINDAIRAFNEAQRASRHPMTERAWSEQHKSLQDALAKRTELEANRRALRTRQAKLRRARLLVPLLAERAENAARRLQLGDVRVLPEHAAAERDRIEREGIEAAERVSEIEAAVADLERA